ncbi:MAG: class I SAM-dependent methyltransferase [Alphaproteobacteria bacterium]|nr:class I SAM-dependent methyltransferase [Alphaproteobacteria bacterium]
MSGASVGPDRYQAWRASTLGQITERLEQSLLLELAGSVQGKDILDLGCGDGHLLASLRELGAKASGIDTDSAMVSCARVLNPDADIRLADAAHLPYADESFDLIVANTLLCLILSPHSVLAEARRVLRPGGGLLIGELNRLSIWALSRRIRGWLGSPLWAKARFSTASSLSAELALAGFQVEQVKGAVFYPPWAWAARLLAPCAVWLGSRTTFGAAYIAITARKR